MKKLQNSISLKIISYIMIPILALNILVNAFSISYYEEYKEEIEDKITYFETQRFADNFFQNIYRKAYNILQSKTSQEYNTDNLLIAGQIEEKKQLSKDINYTNTYGARYDYLIIDNEGKAYTNIEKTVYTDTLEKLKQYVQAKKYFWIYENNKVKTSVEKMKYENIAYDAYFEQIKENNFTIYSCVKDEESNEFHKYNLVYELVSSTYKNAPANIPISVFLLLVAVIYVVVSIGHKKDEEGIYTNSLDDIPLEIVGIVSWMMLFIEATILIIAMKSILNTTSLSNSMVDMLIWVCVLIGFIIYMTLATTGVTIIRRIKAKVFWKNTIIYKFINWVKRGINNILYLDTNTSVKLVLTFVGYTVLQFLLAFLMMASNPIFVIWLLILWIITLKLLSDRLNKNNKIKAKIKEIYEGNQNALPLNEEEFKGELKEVAKELNDIQGGLSNAIEEAMKSERLKTELITNVSHDIKTPLTSIINYVDLIKKENIENEKVKEYLEVLDNKSRKT